MNSGYVNFPVRGDYILLEKAKTIVNLVVFDSISSTNGVDFEDYNTHLFLTGVFISDDIKDNEILDVDLTIDELVNEQMKMDAYTSLYFPNYDIDSMDIMRYLSTPLLSSTVLGIADCVYEKKAGTFWNCKIDDLDDNGKRLYGLMVNLYPGKDVRILTFVDNI